MRRLTIGLAVAVAVALLGYAAVGQPPGGQERQERGQRDRQTERGRPGRGGFAVPGFPLMTALDADRDGEISAAEMKNAAAALQKLDKDGNGRLTRDEFGPPPGRFGGPGFGGRGAPGIRGPGRGMRPAQRESEIVFGRPPLPKDEAEKKILSVLEDLDQNQRRGMMNVPEEDGRLLRLLAEAVGAERVVEIGTSNGYSGIWFCLALRKTGGKLITHEIDARRASLARENFKRAGVDQIVTLVEGDAHEEVAKLKEPIDVLFLDADKEGYIDYLNKLLPLVRPGGLIVAHNMNPRQADPEYVKFITANPDLETLFLHMQGAGVGVTLKKR